MLTRMTGAQAFMEIIISEGVEYVFGNPGSSELDILDAVEACPKVRYILGLQEGTPMGMADGYARASGKPGVVNVHSVVGLCNAMVGLYNAFRGGSNVVLTVGQLQTDAIVRDGLSSGDRVRLARQFTKWGAEISCTADIPMVMRRAFKVAAQPPPGPVLVSLPMDTLENSEEMEIAPVSHLYSRSRPDSEAVAKAASLLANSKNPAIYVGDRVAQSHAVAETVTLAETLGAKVYAARMTELNFPMNHQLFMGINQFGDANTSRLLTGVDVVLIIGANLGIHTYQHHEAPFPDNTKIIHVDISPWEVAKNYPVELGIIADCKAGLRDLIDSVHDTMSPAQCKAAASRVTAIGQITAKMRETAEREAQASWDSVPISLPRLMKQLREAIEPGTVITSEAITAWGALRRYLEPSEPGTYFTTPSGALGWGMPGALGVKLALPDRPVIAVVGDGAGMYSIQALWTAARYNIPVTYIICNNTSYDTLKVSWMAYRGKAFMPEEIRGYTALDNPTLDYAKIAGAFGIRGQRVEKPADLAPALEEALQSGEPTVVDVVIQPITPK